MEYFAGLDVAMKETAICVVDAEGKTIIEGKAASEPDAIADFLHPFRDKLRRIGHEAGALSPWLQRGLIARDLKVVCLETIHVRSVLKAQRNKTDKNDARGLAQMMRTGWFREVHVKSDESYRLRLLLTHRRNLKRKFLDLENAIRHSLKVFGIKLNLDMAFLGIDQGAVKNAVRLLCAPLDRAREEHKQDIARVTANWGFSPPVAYRPSYLRKRPIIELDDGVMYCPLPELVALRTTAGLYYDLVGGPSNLRNEASKRFEMYSADFVRRTTRFEVSDEIEYRIGQRNWRTPDVLCERNGAVLVAIECKASKLTYDAQFAETPAAFAKRGYEELAKGVVQLWRFVAHCRLGVAPKRADASVRCLLLTLDTWLAMSGDLKREVIAAAKELAKGEPDILEEDQRPIVFASIYDLERTLMDGSEETFLDAMDHAATESFTGWMLADVQRDRGNEKRTDREYPFEVADVLPFFAAIDQLKDERAGKLAG